VATPDEFKDPVPKVALPFLKVTVPVGVVVPEAGVTVAVKVTLAPMLIELADEVSVVVVPTSGLNEVMKLFASTDPNPVTWSYPTPALYPNASGGTEVLVQFGVPLVQGTMLLPVVTSWKAVGVPVASGYSRVLILPMPAVFWKPFATLYWFKIAITPANTGADADVPPTLPAPVMVLQLFVAAHNT
jgi:hypothetical protein